MLHAHCRVASWELLKLMDICNDLKLHWWPATCKHSSLLHNTMYVYTYV